MFTVSTSHKVLKHIYIHKELSVADFVALFPRKFNDHRDFYIAAHLINAGYVGRHLTTTITRPDRTTMPWSEQPPIEIALRLHFYTMPADAKEYKLPYFDQPISTPVGGPLEDPFYSTEKTELYFQERWEKRLERLFAVFVAILAAALTAYFTSVFAGE